MPTTITESDKRYKKVVETYIVPPEPIELFFWYGGTHPAGLSVDNPYRRKNWYSTKTKYVEVKDGKES